MDTQINFDQVIALVSAEKVDLSAISMFFNRENFNLNTVLPVYEKLLEKRAVEQQRVIG